MNDRSTATLIAFFFVTIELLAILAFLILKGGLR